MQFLKTLLWVLLAGLALAFAFNNWNTVPINLWGGLMADVNLPFLVLVAFLLGFVPTLLVLQATRWRLRQRIATLQRTLDDLRQTAAPLPVPPSQAEQRAQAGDAPSPGPGELPLSPPPAREG